MVRIVQLDNHTPNDPLLNGAEYKLVTKKENLNIYRIISAYHKHLRPLTRHYHLDKKGGKMILDRLLSEFNTLEKATETILKKMEAYRGKRYKSRIKEKWRLKDNLSNGNISIECARVISLVSTNNDTEAVNTFDEILNQSSLMSRGKKLKYPVKIPELDGRMAYLTGLIAGDGHITKHMNETKIVDGHKDKLRKKQSDRFLENVDALIKEKFGCVGVVEEKNNYKVYSYGSALMFRIFNYIYEIPAGRKSKSIEVPKILKNSSLEKLFWRGIFDSDGSIREKGKSIRLTTTSRKLVSGFLDFCKRHEIILFEGKNKPSCFTLLVAEESIPTFARVVGSSHPRKKANLIRYLKEGATYKIPICKKPNKRLCNIISNLRPYRKNIYIRLTVRRERTNRTEIMKRLQLIEKITGKKIVEIKRQRKNNHFYICSKDLLKEINEHYEFRYSWSPWCDEEIGRLERRWNRYG